jgi:hypothetical protein
MSSRVLRYENARNGSRQREGGGFLVATYCLVALRRGKDN